MCFQRFSNECSALVSLPIFPLNTLICCHRWSMVELLNSFVYVVQVCHSVGDGDIPFKSPTISYHLNDASYYFVYFDHRL